MAQQLNQLGNAQMTGLAQEIGSIAFQQYQNAEVPRIQSDPAALYTEIGTIILARVMDFVLIEQMAPDARAQFNTDRLDALDAFIKAEKERLAAV